MYCNRSAYHFIDAQLLGVKHKVGRFHVDRPNRKLLVVEANVLDLGPLERSARKQFVALLVDVEAHRGDAQPEIGVFLVLKVTY